MHLNDYKKIAIVGCPGSGKSTLARQIGAQTGHPVIHMDYENWQPGWVPTPKEELIAKQEQWVRKERWIIDGNYGGTMELRFAAADLVIFLDLPRLLCVWRVIRRHGQLRPDLRPGVVEVRKISLDFLSFLGFILSSRWRNSHKILRLHRKYQRVAFLRLRSRKEVCRFIGGLP